jgi:uncharacterized membrane protein
MNLSQLHYFPLTLPFFSFLVGAFLFLVILIQLDALRYAYMRLGLTYRAALLLLLGSLLGSYVNIPIAELAQKQVESGQEIQFFGMRYVVPVVVNWPGTVLAINVGGAIIPSATSIYLLFRHKLWIKGAVISGIVAAICYSLARPVPGLGIALPVFIPALSTALTAFWLSRQNMAVLAYVGGCFGTLIGADLLNLGKLQGLGAPIASIGGAGTFDGIFLTGILAVLLASLGDWFGAKPTHSDDR